MSRFTQSDVLAAIETAVAANPDGLNPMSGTGINARCLNRAVSDDAPTPRCIASQVHFDLTGRELEGVAAASISQSLDTTYDFDPPFDWSAKSLLADAQIIFDRFTTTGHTWSEALLELQTTLSD